MADQPASAAFWVLCAPILFQVLAIELLLPVFAVVMQQSETNLSVGWLTLSVGGAIQFTLLSVWSQSRMAGGLAGPAFASPAWLSSAMILGPLCLLIPSFTIAQLFPESSGWQYSESVDPAVFEPENWALGFLVYAVIIAPVVEEVTFRGVALAALARRGVPVPLAIILSSAAFAGIHLQYSFAALIVVFLAGVGFCFIRIASRSMLAAIAAHASANAVMLVIQASASPPPA
ncbi:MAG: CPBP family intramembrane glutamic endopeptidase [Pseudomonadota bacterium]